MRMLNLRTNYLKCTNLNNHLNSLSLDFMENPANKEKFEANSEAT